MSKDEYPHILGARSFTHQKLLTLRDELEQALSGGKYRDAITLVTTGSYGRGEAMEESDLDWFMIFDRDQPAEEVIADEMAEVANIIRTNVPKNTGDTGTFGKEVVVRFSEMQRNIGGKDDSNDTLTRRLLFLLEATWLYGDDRFHSYRRQLLEKYIKPTSPDDQLPRFLLNDIIRYYRTIATDFEFKTSESNKPWGLRNIKLRFSRKLIYFSGIVVAAELRNLDWAVKVDRAIELFDQPVLERVAALNDGSSCTGQILSAYESFMGHVSNPEVRQKLEAVQKETRLKCPEYRQLRDASYAFSLALHKWLTEKYQADHPIHHALVF